MRGAVVLCAIAAGCAYDRPRLAGDGGPVDALDAPIDAPDDVADARIDALDPPLDAPLDASASDVDGDGVPNLSDNCPTVANPFQYDDDADAVGDVCDVCPHRNNAIATPNADGDDIGDTCGDPDANAPHCIAWFDGFGASATLPRYTLLGGNWTIAGGALVQQTNSAIEAVAKVTGVTFRGPTVLARVTIDGVGPSSPTRSAGVASQLGAAVSGVPDGFVAELNQDSGDTRSLVQVSEVRAGVARTASAEHTGGFQSEIPFDVVLGPPGASVRASVTLLADTIATSLVTTPPALADGSAGVRTRRVSASFNYLLVVQPGGNGTCPVRAEP